MSRKFFCLPVAAKSKIPNEHDDLGVGRGPAVLISIGALGCLWLALVVFGWARWGSVTVDCGRELYVAAALAEGKMLYRDVWYMYGPGAPYLNSLLFRTFGIHINTTYLCGIPSRSGHRADTVPLRAVRCAATGGVRGRLYSVDPIFRRRDL